MPDSNSHTSESVLPTEVTRISFSLVYFNFFNDFSQRGTIPGSVFTHNTDFLGVFGHFEKRGDSNWEQ